MMQGLIARGEKDGVKFDEKGYEVSCEYLRTILKGLLARDLYEDSSYYRVVNETNPVYREALRLINSPREYSELLNP